MPRSSTAAGPAAPSGRGGGRTGTRVLSHTPTARRDAHSTPHYQPRHALCRSPRALYAYSQVARWAPPIEDGQFHDSPRCATNSSTFAALFAPHNVDSGDSSRPRSGRFPSSIRFMLSVLTLRMTLQSCSLDVFGEKAPEPDDFSGMKKYGRPLYGTTSASAGSSFSPGTNVRIGVWSVVLASAASVGVVRSTTVPVAFRRANHLSHSSRP